MFFKKQDICLNIFLNFKINIISTIKLLYKNGITLPALPQFFTHFKILKPLAIFATIKTVCFACQLQQKTHGCR